MSDPYYHELSSLLAKHPISPEQVKEIERRCLGEGFCGSNYARCFYAAVYTTLNEIRFPLLIIKEIDIVTKVREFSEDITGLTGFSCIEHDIYRSREHVRAVMASLRRLVNG